MTKYIKIEALATLGDIHINLESLFNKATQIYEENHKAAMIARTAHYAPDSALSDPKVTPHPQTIKYERKTAALRPTYSEMPQTYESIVALFKRGRELEEQCIPCTTTAQFGCVQNSLNTALKEMGFDIVVI